MIYNVCGVLRRRLVVVLWGDSAEPNPPKLLKIIGFIRFYKIMRNNGKAKAARDNMCDPLEIST